MASHRRRVAFSLPTKTFLVGEYSVLKGGPAIVLTTEPRFQISLQRKPIAREAVWTGFSEAGPGRKFLQKNRTLFRDYDLEFVRPISVGGGVGTSSAEFAAAYLIEAWLRSKDRQATPDWDMAQLLKAYRELAWDGQGQAPSGADVISQIVGGVTYVHPEHLIYRELNWPFADLGFLILTTGHKVATHEHLATLGELEVEDLVDSAELIAGAIERADSEMLVTGVNEYAEILRFKNLVYRPTLDLISEVFHWPGVVAAKGCGALGADVVLVVYEVKGSFDLLYHVEKSSMKLFSTHDQITAGWRLEGYKSVGNDEEV